MIQLDYIIVGQGIAGSVLAYTLIKRQKRVLVIDDVQEANASLAASGVCNPITGRRLVKTWLAHPIFSYLHQFYPALEEDTHSRFFYPKEVFRTFNSIKDQNEWHSKASEGNWKAFAQSIQDFGPYKDFIDIPHGGWETKQAAYINTQAMLKAVRGYLQNAAYFLDTHFHFEDLKIAPQQISWKEWQAPQIIFCEGAKGSQNPYFKYLPFRLDKGEWLKVHIPGLTLDKLIKKEVFIIPLEPEHFLISGTYHAQFQGLLPSKRARVELEEKLDRVLLPSYKVLEQRAGIRPATKHRRPFLGAHPKHPELLIFNGMGTKGLSLSPYLAQVLVEHVEEGSDLPPECNIEQYQHLFGAS